MHVNSFWISDRNEIGKNIIFGDYMSSYVDIENKKNYILTHMQRLDDTTLTAEDEYSISFSEQGNNFV